eukprot:10749369-Alexandrium_andersonii.AAC.1
MISTTAPFTATSLVFLCASVRAWSLTFPAPPEDSGSPGTASDSPSSCVISAARVSSCSDCGGM